MTGKVAFAMLLGALGGLCAHRLNFPLPWMIGPLLVISVAAYSGAPVAMWPSLRDWMIGVVGVLIGGSFVPGVFDHVGDWLVTLLAMVVCTIMMMAGGAALLHRGFAQDRVTALLGGAPGTLSQMIALSGNTSADIRAVSLWHTIRLTMMVLLAPALLATQPDVPESVTAADDRQGFHLAVLAVCLLGFPLARLCRLPSPALLGPALASAVVHYTGLVRSGPPEVVLGAAQIAIAASVGARFVGVSPRLLGQLLFSALSLTAFLTAAGFMFAAALYWMTSYDFPLLLLSFLPGGTNEMVIVALALSMDPAFVASHHLLRMVVVTAVAPILVKFLDRNV